MNEACYLDDAQTQEELKRRGISLEQALDDFTQTTHKALADQGKMPVVWEGEFSISRFILKVHRAFKT